MISIPIRQIDRAPAIPGGDTTSIEGCEQVPPFCPACGCGLDVINNNDELVIYVCSFCGHLQSFDAAMARDAMTELAGEIEMGDKCAH